VIPSNPASRVKPPKVARTEAKYLDEKQTAVLLQLLENKSVPHQTMIKMFLYSGLRRGEMCGLEWADIDFENHLITV
jgi:integrase